MIKQKFKLGFQWPTIEPFLFCVHHNDQYPKGTPEFGPESKHLRHRNIGEDFQPKDGFRMYHGDVVPGFPVHPHRGFETITIVRRGFVDHADSIGAAGRYGQGDVQWMTAGRGVQHSEMFPLLNQAGENPMELFQIWLNLPRAQKMSEPHFTMFWSEKIPQLQLDNERVQLTVIAGTFKGTTPLAPPPQSWASQINSNVAIWLIKMKKNGQLQLPPASNETTRMVYFYEGQKLQIDHEIIEAQSGAEIAADQSLTLIAPDGDVEVLILQARSIGEAVVQHGPFVMNSKEEIMQTFREYEQTRFGGWPWPRADMVHGPNPERFAQFPDGRIEKPGDSSVK
jgi:quercetin 2,3-dioxygenase